MKIVVGDNLINYLDLGDANKPAVVFLHGWLDSLQTFNELVKFLEKDYRLILVDLPGFGGSTISNKNWELSDYVIFLKLFLGKINLIPFAYVGHSFGGRVLIKGLGTNSLQTEKLILIASAGIMESVSVQNQLLFLLSKILKFLLSLPIINIWGLKIKKYFYKLLGSDYMNSKHLEVVYKKIINEDLRKEATKINCETLLIYGDKDKATPISYGIIFNKLIPNSKLEIINGSGHFVHQEQAGLASEQIINFLQK